MHFLCECSQWSFSPDHGSLRHPHDLAVLGAGGQPHRRRRHHLLHPGAHRREAAGQEPAEGPAVQGPATADRLRQPRGHLHDRMTPGVKDHLIFFQLNRI